MDTSCSMILWSFWCTKWSVSKEWLVCWVQLGNLPALFDSFAATVSTGSNNWGLEVLKTQSLLWWSQHYSFQLHATIAQSIDLLSSWRYPWMRSQKWLWALLGKFTSECHPTAQYLNRLVGTTSLSLPPSLPPFLHPCLSLLLIISLPTTPRKWYLVMWSHL